MNIWEAIEIHKNLNKPAINLRNEHMDPWYFPPLEASLWDKTQFVRKPVRNCYATKFDLMNLWRKYWQWMTVIFLINFILFDRNHIKHSEKLTLHLFSTFSEWRISLKINGSKTYAGFDLQIFIYFGGIWKYD